ncbi:hypothetical protein [Oligoflexus tunisiensis]|uniref:hypothetical protein n=1 Tax=Oligoflexus tunisiensis TaxID=708132 RepID=UPI00114CF5EB|nr:hypothetical protein [Oligoflexus tunisiensis]
MRRNQRSRSDQHKVQVLLAGAALTLISCSGKSSSSDAAATSGQLIIATDIADMGLSKALSTEVPAAVKGQGEEALPTAGTILISTPGLRRADRQRAIEGCEIRRSVKNGLNLIREMAQEICYIEAGSQVFKPNGKFRASFDEDGWQGTYSVWIDDTVQNRRRISFCANDKLRYIFDLEAANAGTAKGVVTRIHTDPDAAEGETWTVQAAFDSGVSRTGRTKLDIRGAYETAYGNSRERLFIDYEEKGIAFVAESKVGESELDDGLIENWTTQSAALIAHNLGTVINKYSSTVDASTDAGAYRAYFDGKGYVLAAADSEAWQPGGPIYVEPKMMPRLPDWNGIDLPSDAWDCTGTTEVTPEGSAADYAQCDALQVDWEEEDCEDESLYTYSGDPETVGDDEVASGDKLEYPGAD